MNFLSKVWTFGIITNEMVGTVTSKSLVSVRGAIEWLKAIRRLVWTGPKSISEGSVGVREAEFTTPGYIICALVGPYNYWDMNVRFGAT